MRNSSARIWNISNMAAIAVSACMLAAPAFAKEIPYERVIDLDGTSNTRDVGGYPVDSARTLRSGQLIRSENLSRLTESDFQKLEEIGVKTVIDLRTVQEHEHAPTVWQGDNPPQFYHFPIGDAQNDWFKKQRQMIRNNRFSEEQSHNHMVEGYRMIADVGTPSYEQLMEVVLDESNWPILFHCNAGKDRAGIATTLILEALDVDRGLIMDEYLLTNEISRTEAKAKLVAKERKKAGSSRKYGRSPSANAWFPIIGVQPEMLKAFYTSVEEEYGSMDAFLTELGVDQEARNSLAAALIVEQPELAMGE